MAILTGAFWAKIGRAWKLITIVFGALVAFAAFVFTIIQIAQAVGHAGAMFWNLSDIAHQTYRKVDATGKDVTDLKGQIEDLQSNMEQLSRESSAHADALQKLNTEPNGIAAIRQLSDQMETNHVDSVSARARQDAMLAAVQKHQSSLDHSFQIMRDQLEANKRHLDEIAAKVLKMGNHQESAVCGIPAHPKCKGEPK